MPSATFYKLPEEKRERLLRAAREEFSRVPYESASVNRIIRSAGIPRGSFYMYFTDKEELFGHLMDSYGALLERRMGELLEQREGDLFAAFLDLFDHIQAHWGDGKYREMADILRCNRQMQPGVLLNREGPEASLARLRDRVDLSRLDLRTETDLSDIFHLLVSAVAGTLVAAGEEKPAAHAPEEEAEVGQAAGHPLGDRGAAGAGALPLHECGNSGAQQRVPALHRRDARHDGGRLGHRHHRAHPVLQGDHAGQRRDPGGPL